MALASVCYLFYQPMDEKIKTWTLRLYVESIVRLANHVAVALFRSFLFLSFVPAFSFQGHTKFALINICIDYRSSKDIKGRV